MGEEDYLTPMSKAQYEHNQKEQLRQRVDEINSSIIPDIPGHVRTDGPRRQHRAEIRNGTLHLTEI